MATRKNPYWDGAIPSAYKFRPTGNQPFDIRVLVASKEDLIDPKQFTNGYNTPGQTGGDPTFYKGMIVGVVADGTVWILSGDTPWVGSASSPVANDYSNWTQVITKTALTEDDKYHTRLYSTGTKIGTGHASLDDLYVPVATSSVAGVMQLGYTQSGQNYPVQLSSNKAYVNVPWTDSLPTWEGES